MSDEKTTVEKAPRKFKEPLTAALAPDGTDAFSEAPTTVAPIPAVLKTVEDWAKEKKHTGFIPTGPLKKGAKRTEVFTWEFQAAKAMFNWPIGRELSEADYDACITSATSAESR